MNHTIKKMFILNLMLAPLLFFSLMVGDTIPSNPSAALVDSNGTITEPLRQILDITNINHDGTLEDIVKKTQKAWLRKRGTERWQMEDAYEKERDRLWPLFRKLGAIESIAPQNISYDYCIILGALTSSVRNRLNYALELWNLGIRFKKLIFLVGQRPLDPNLENTEILYNRNNTDLPIKEGWREPTAIPMTETDMAKMIFEQAELPQDFLNQIMILFIDAPGKITKEGTFARPTTADTVESWLATNPKAGTILAISSQPYVEYQHAVVKSLLPKIFTLETVGKQANNHLKIATILDNIARWLYAENINHMQHQ